MMDYNRRGANLRRLRQEIELVKGRIRTACHELAEDQANARRILLMLARLDAQRRRLETHLQIEEILDCGDSEEGGTDG